MELVVYPRYGSKCELTSDLEWLHVDSISTLLAMLTDLRACDASDRCHIALCKNLPIIP